jgi:hypothetical protein
VQCQGISGEIAARNFAICRICFAVVSMKSSDLQPNPSYSISIVFNTESSLPPAAVVLVVATFQIAL